MSQKTTADSKSKKPLPVKSAAGNQKPKVIGYLRVSTGDQELEKNKSDILRLANHLNLGQVNFVEEIVSGKVSWKKRKIAKIIEDFKKDDTLMVSELSRLGRSMLECMEIFSVAVEKGVRVYAVKGNWSLDSSIQSKIVAMAFSMASEIERDLISQRTKEALRYKKEQGIKLGRHPVPANQSSTNFARKSKPCLPMAQPRGLSLAGITQPKRISATGSVKTACGSNNRQAPKTKLSVVLFYLLCQITPSLTFSHFSLLLKGHCSVRISNDDPLKIFSSAFV